VGLFTGWDGPQGVCGLQGNHGTVCRQLWQGLMSQLEGPCVACKGTLALCGFGIPGFKATWFSMVHTMLLWALSAGS
jgi:hypothetical protein